MNAKKLIAAVAVFAAAGSAVAANPEYVDFAGFQGTKSRAEVKAELKQAQNSGAFVVGGQQYEGQFAAATQTARGEANANEIARNSKAVNVSATN